MSFLKIIACSLAVHTCTGSTSSTTRGLDTGNVFDDSILVRDNMRDFLQKMGIKSEFNELVKEANGTLVEVEKLTEAHRADERKAVAHGFDPTQFMMFEPKPKPTIPLNSEAAQENAGIDLVDLTRQFRKARADRTSSDAKEVKSASWEAYENRTKVYRFNTTGEQVTYGLTLSLGLLACAGILAVLMANKFSKCHAVATWSIVAITMGIMIGLGPVFYKKFLKRHETKDQFDTKTHHFINGLGMCGYAGAAGSLTGILWQFSTNTFDKKTWSSIDYELNPPSYTGAQAASQNAHKEFLYTRIHGDDADIGNVDFSEIELSHLENELLMKSGSVDIALVLSFILFSILTLAVVIVKVCLFDRAQHAGQR